MIIPVKCFTCGKVLANKWEAYKEAVENENKNTPNEPTRTAQNFNKSFKAKVLDDIGLDRICCRRHMLTHVDLIDMI